MPTIGTVWIDEDTGNEYTYTEKGWVVDSGLVSDENGDGVDITEVIDVNELVREWKNSPLVIPEIMKSLTNEEVERLLEEYYFLKSKKNIGGVFAYGIFLVVVVAIILGVLFPETPMQMVRDYLPFLL